MSKRVAIIALAGVNAVLLWCLLSSATSGPQALAQEAGAAQGEFIVIAARAKQNQDALYLLDVENQRLHAFRTQSLRSFAGPTRLILSDSRDLKRDFRVRQGAEEDDR